MHFPSLFTPTTIFKANRLHYPQLIALWEASVRATHFFLSKKDIAQYKLLIEGYYFDQLNIYYLKCGKTIIGFIGLKKDSIQLLFIAPEQMGNGNGKALIDYAIKKRGAKTVDVNEQNVNALGFYKKIGFEIIERSQTDNLRKPFPVLSLKLA